MHASCLEFFLFFIVFVFFSYSISFILAFLLDLGHLERIGNPMCCWRAFSGVRIKNVAYLKRLLLSWYLSIYLSI